MEELRASAKRLALLQHKDDTDEQLRETVLRNVRAIGLLPSTNQGAMEGYKLLGEVDGCNEILAQRQAKRQKTQDAKDKWKRELADRRKKAVLNLPNAVSSNGQLVAAILEDEDGKTAEELHGWCDELAALSDEDFNALLNGLVDEGILRRKGKSYRLLTPCTEELTYTMKAWEDRVKELYESPEERDIADAFLLLLRSTDDELYSIGDFFRDLKNDIFTSDRLDKVRSIELGDFKVKRVLDKLCKAHVLELVYQGETENISDRNKECYYQFALLGERRS